MKHWYHKLKNKIKIKSKRIIEKYMYLKIKYKIKKEI